MKYVIQNQMIQLNFYDLLHKQIISKVNNIKGNGCSNMGFIMISKDLLLIPGINKI